MPEQVTFEVHRNTNNPCLPPWTIRVYPIDIDNAPKPPDWLATVTPHGLTIQGNGITDHIAWPAFLAGTSPQGSEL